MTGDLANFFGSLDGFDTHSIAPQEDFAPIPPGDYPVEIEKSEMKATKSQNGHYLEITCKILDGPDGVKGRKLWDRLNLDNPSQQAQEIALRSFAALGQSLNLARIQDTQQIVGGRCIACVKVREGQNSIRTYKPLPVAQVAPLASAMPVAPVAPIAPAPPVAAPAPVVPAAMPAAPAVPVAPAASVAAPAAAPWQR